MGGDPRLSTGGAGPAPGQILWFGEQRRASTHPSRPDGLRARPGSGSAQLHAQRVAGEIDDTVLLLEHPPVYTAGRRTEAWERPTDGTPVIDVDRGGKITWHGPGQLVGYPIVRLPDPVDVVAYVRRLEDGADRRLRRARRRRPSRVEGRSGVWVPADDARPGPQGRRDRRSGSPSGVTMHGFALNCDRDLAGSTASSRAASPTPASRR